MADTNLLWSFRVSRALALLAALFVLVCSRGAKAQDAKCEDDVRAWAARCAQSQSIELTAPRCPDGRVVFRIQGDLEVELRAGDGFRKVGELSLSPIAQIADWSKEPLARRDGLERLANCVSQASPPLRRVPGHGSSSSLPWLLLLAAVMGAAALGRQLGTRAAARSAIWVLGAMLATLGLRAFCVPLGFLHQNGHGPRWVQIALQGPSEYGPGFAELFAAAARSSLPAAELGVFRAQGVLAALSPACIWLACRSLGTTRIVAASCAGLVAFEPVLARMARSESYFSAITSLAFIAIALLAAAFARARIDRRSVLFALAAAAVLAQAVRVHPLGWVPLALTPAVALLGTGSARRRLRLALVAFAFAGLVVVVTSGSALWHIAQGQLGRAWLPRAGVRFDVLTEPPVLRAFILASLPAVLLRNPRGILLSGVALSACFLAATTDMLSAPNPVIDAASRRAYLPLLLCVGAVASDRTLRRLARRADARAARRRRFLPAAAAVALTGLAWRSHLHTVTLLPTDALEAREFAAWRAALPEDATVLYLGRAGQGITMLPLYSEGKGPHAHALSVDSAHLGPLPRATHYYRSSLCSTAAGRLACAEHLRRWRLSQLRSATFPARSSMRWMEYEGAAVEIALYRIEP
ncbi:MAG: hypothetical protein R3B13_17325 [Polyangiaceae bacterium]